MIVERITGFYKVGKAEEGLALLVEELKRAKPPHGYHTFTPQIGVLYRYATDLEFENMTEREQFWNDWGASPGANAFLQKWYPLIEPGEIHEIWELI